MLVYIDLNYLCPECGNLMLKERHKDHPRKVLVKCVREDCTVFNHPQQIERDRDTTTPGVFKSAEELK